MNKRFLLTLFLLILFSSSVQASVIGDFFDKITGKYQDFELDVMYGPFEGSIDEEFSNEEDIQTQTGSSCAAFSTELTYALEVWGGYGTTEDEARRGAIQSCKEEAEHTPYYFEKRISSTFVNLAKRKCVAAKLDADKVCVPVVKKENNINEDTCKSTTCEEVYIGLGEFRYECRAIDGSYTIKIDCQEPESTKETKYDSTIQSFNAIGVMESNLENAEQCILENLDIKESSGIIHIKAKGTKGCENKAVAIIVKERGFFQDKIVIDDNIYFNKIGEGEYWKTIEDEILSKEKREYYLMYGIKKSELFFNDNSDLIIEAMSSNLFMRKDFTGEESAWISLEMSQINWESFSNPILSNSCKDPEKIAKVRACADKCTDKEKLKVLAGKINEQYNRCMNVCQNEPSLQGRINCEHSCKAFTSIDNLDVQIFVREQMACIRGCLGLCPEPFFDRTWVNDNLISNT